MSKPGRAATPALAALQRAGVTHTVRRYEHDPSADSFGQEAAEKLGLEPRRVFKTLMVTEQGDPRNLAIGIVPVSGHLSLKAMAQAMGVKKCAMASVDVAEKTSGYVAGGISPLGQRRQLPTFIDQTADQWETIFVSGGQRGLDVELAPCDLLRLTHGTYAQISD